MRYRFKTEVTVYVDAKNEKDAWQKFYDKLEGQSKYKILDDTVCLINCINWIRTNSEILPLESERGKRNF